MNTCSAMLLWTLIICGPVSADPAHSRSVSYHVLGPGERSKRLVVDLRLTELGRVERDGAPYVDWQMDLELGDGRRISVRAESKRMPMTSTDGCGAFASYQVRLPEGEAYRYRDERTGMAVLPKVAFRELFLPTPDEESVLVDGYRGSGMLLGHIILLDRGTPASARVDSREVVPVSDAKTLDLRPDLIIGTSRNFKDDGTGRPTPTANYTYVNFVESDYREMIDAGINYYGVDKNQIEWVRDEPVFYRPQGADVAWPEDYYRSNFWPAPMFTDEPMVRLAFMEGKTPPNLSHPRQMASFLSSRVRHIYSEYGHSALDPITQYLGRSGIHLSLDRWDFIQSPTWETEYQVAYYELAGGAAGIVHEGRYDLNNYGWHPDLLFGPGLEMAPAEMMKCYYAFLRGAARAFDRDWGMSIYGQSDPALRELAMSMAYDMGAKDIWYWTSDHDHHMEWPLQLALTRSLLDHAKKHPRGEMDDLRRTANVAVVFPYGYCLMWDRMWGPGTFMRESLNEAGVSYRDVVCAAMWEGILLARRGVPFDFQIDHDGIRDLGYAELIFVQEDAGVTREPIQVEREPKPSHISLSVSDGEPLEEVAAGDGPIAMMSAYSRRIEIDGMLDEWETAEWEHHSAPESGGGAWNGPLDLMTKIAFACDSEALYVAAVVWDDVHRQPFYGYDMWMGDSIQIGLDPLNQPNEFGKTQNHHEFGLARLDDGRNVVWRWEGRVGQPLREIAEAQLATVRQEGAKAHTIYEARLPLSVLSPFSPQIRPAVGVGVTFNDADEGIRESYHETSPGSMTEGKYPEKYRNLVAPKLDEEARRQANAPHAWATIVWNDTVMERGEALAVDLATCAWVPQPCELEARLTPLPPLQVLPACAVTRFGARSSSEARTINVEIDAEPGRYRLDLIVRDRSRAVLANESTTVFVYPAGRR